MKKNVNLAVVGLGLRGSMLIKDPLLLMDNVTITAICDLEEDRIEEMAKLINETKGITPFETKDYRDILIRSDVDAVLICCAWEAHIPIAVDTMKAKKIVGLEVGGAFSLDQCWELVKTYEETQTPFMFLENCCYGRVEMTALNMARDNFFGEIVHCSGAYEHTLQDEIATGFDKRHYRLRNYMHRNCENYPTHELGPIAKVLNINNTNRMVTLTSTSSKSAAMHDYCVNVKKDGADLKDVVFNQGDIVTTVIKCANGETIVLTLDTTAPADRYHRRFCVRGTHGMYEELLDSVYQVDVKDGERKEIRGKIADFEEKYMSDTWKEFLKNGAMGGHDGMDTLVYGAFIDCIINDKPFPIDVYDAASWMAISVLSEQSILLGSTAVYIPDFTNGKWMIKKENLL